MKNFINNFQSSKSLFIGIITLAIIVIAYFSGLRQLIDKIETITYDWRAQISTDKGPLNSKFTKASKDIILLSADDYSFQKLSEYPELGIGRWPWQRKVWGDIVNYISPENPKAIVFDIKFEGAEGNNPENIESDNYFAQSIKNNKNIILGLALSYPRINLSREINRISKEKDFDNYKVDKLIYKALKLQTAPFRDNLGLKFDGSSNYTKSYITNLFNSITFYGNSSIASSILDRVNHVGVINLESGENMVARYNVPLYRLFTGNDASYLPSLPLAAVYLTIPENEKTPLIFEGNNIVMGKRIIPIDSNGRLLLNWHGHKGTYKSISIVKAILTHAYKQGKIKQVSDIDLLPDDTFRDKIIVIGQTSAGTDFHSTPMDMVYPGVEIIATAIDNYLNDTDTTNPKARKFITIAPFGINFIILIVFCSATGIFIARTESVLLGISWFLLLIFLFILFSIIVFVHPNIRLWTNMSYPLIFMVFTAIGTYIYKVYTGEKEKKVVKNLFGKFVSPQVLEKLLNDPKSISQDGQKKVMTVLFSDIRGFTALSETIPPQELISQLNEYMTEMVEIILKYDGTLDKYIGDAIMAFYGDPLPMKDHALKAVLTAIDMKKSLLKLNEKWQSEGKPVFDTGIGINTGEMIVGHMGSPKLLDYTVLGDNVNLASRLEGLNKNYKADIIISESTNNEIKDYINTSFLDECAVRGRQNIVKIYNVEGLKLENPENI